jgi:DNA repair protein RecO (recombination protein O)
MLHTTRGIALHTVKFSETSIIAKIYTELFGLQSYLVRGIRKEKAKIKPGLFQPLMLLELSAYHKEKATLQTIREVNILKPYHSLPFDIRKSSVALYINELIYRSVREEEKNPELFAFLFNTCEMLDSMDTGLSLFPLAFTVYLTKLLGFYPRTETDSGIDIFNMTEGVFQDKMPEHKYYIPPPGSLLLKEIILTGTYDFSAISFYQEILRTRNDLLESMLVYYKLHLPGFGDIRSHKVLHTVLS